MVSKRVFLKSALFTILVPGTVAMALPQLLAKYRPHPKLPIEPNVGRVLGGLSIFAGVLVYLRTVFQFGTDGRGTPSPTDDPDDLVTGGLYARTRNPMYIGVLLVILGQAFRQRSVAILWWGVGMWIGFHNRVIGYEEPHLVEKHGEAYEEYRDRVPRWLSFTRPPR
ncbi:isoprenylcysteine carboxylmethyltransferase family protein [Natrarchaeobius halalkaliphilus]|uniref:Isoprenylcysteine carboxylmethyltransferase family protein n=1 Tax=Natrarchaeobius halalkaliphilus TaxID=1679091 RepID=A0A3N6LWC2_9EURY|nr:isoprenylcysteine carboxylmethyltransferase family protein [Natrarchaeobius halalkaliphilus]RQG93137.1 isoprenylcysteine carboxylmethyltransferase family protein [Natrarchaeobius halalkaliphilus]